MLIRGGTVITMDERRRIIPDGAVLVRSDRIADVGESGVLCKKYPDEEVVDADGKLVLPGLINAHTHTLYYLSRGLGMDGSLLTWLRRYIVPFFCEMSEDDAYTGALAGYLENLVMGNTLVVDNFYAPGERKKAIADSVARAARDAGIRAVLARCYADKARRLPEAFVESIDEVAGEYERLIDSWHDHGNGRIKVWIAPITLPSCSGESFVELSGLAAARGIGVHTHCAETQESLEMVRAEYGKGFVEVFSDLGVLGPKFHAVHSVWVSEAELRLLRDTRTRVIHNPVANMVLAEGVAPIPELRRMGVCVGLGTDSPNNSQDLLRTMKAAVMLHRVDTERVEAMTSLEVLEMATIEGARALGMETDLGSIEAGKKADIVLVNTWRFHSIPNHDPVASLVYSSSGSDVDTVIVDGKVLVQGGQLLFWDRREVLEGVQDAALRLRGRAFDAAERSELH
jgi:5-methylthioadenosine/S-adenosylhomocysteine deaminase